MKKTIYITLTLLIVGIIAYNLGIKGAKINIETSSSVFDKSKRVVPELKLPVLKYTMPHIDELDEITQKIVGFDSGLSFTERSKLVKKLRERKLTKKDFEAFFTFLRQNPLKPGNQLTWHSLKNDLLVTLIDDGRYKESMGHLMNSIINDQKQHVVMREYVLQYTTDYFERHWQDRFSAKELTNYSSEDVFQQSQMIKTMYKALHSSNGPIAGTALIRLHELSQGFSFVDQEEINRETERILSDRHSAESSRMAALSIVVERGLVDLKKVVERITFDRNESVMTRVTALSALGKYPINERTLTRISNEIINDQSCDKRLQRAAKFSIDEILRRRG